MQFIRPDTRYDFIGKKNIALLISTIAILIGLGSIAVQGGLKYGVDFAGGLLVQVKFGKPIDIAEVRSGLEALGFKDANVQKFGETDEYLVRVEKASENLEEVSKTMQSSIREQFKDKAPEIRRVELVGPKVGKDLKEKALWATGLSFLAMLIYVAFRFHEFAYGLGGIAALVYDILITFGAISLLRLEFSLSLLAVILTIIGFSINDTIVIFDRVRENIKKLRKDDLPTIFNISINETLGRTILTSGTVMMVILILLFFGGPVIHDFALAMVIGLISGTYSTVYIASPVVLLWEKNVSGRKRKR